MSYPVVKAAEPGRPAATVGLFLGLTLGLGLAYASAGVARPAPRAQARAAVADIRAAVDIIVQAADSNTTGPSFFRRSAQKAINALVGRGDPAYRAAAGDPASAAGAIGHMNALLHRAGAHPWHAPVHGAWVNTMVAVANLGQAVGADELGDFQADISQALGRLQIALGRASEAGTLGGLEGALANTALGVPAGAKRVSGCAPASAAPAYGLTQGYLAFYAAPVDARGKIDLPQVFGERRMTIHDGRVVLHTAAAAKVAKLCQRQAQSRPAAPRPAAGAKPKPAPTPNRSAKPKPSPPAESHSDKRSPPAVKKASAGSALPALYQQKQARRGKQLFANHCASCHGSHAQGGSAPANAGTQFLENAQRLGWSVSDLRYLVVNTMPLNNPSSLTRKQYARVLAYLLAASCYPAGNSAFPTADTPVLKKTKLAPPKNISPDNAKLGVCKVP